MRCAFVSTNSITQGEQVGVLWGWMLAQGIKIHFAHRTFSWSNEARGNAAVHCVIVGFGSQDVVNKTIYEYEDIKGEPHAVKANNINPYLVDAADVVLPRRSKPICKITEIGIGNKPIDGGYYLFTQEDKERFLISEPGAADLFRRWIGAEEFLNGSVRWCLWLGACSPEALRKMPRVLERIELVKEFRLGKVPNIRGKKSEKLPPISTQSLAKTPTKFHVEFIPNKPFMVIPEVSSERRTYIPLGYLTPDVLASNKLRLLPNATLFEFGILSSFMHMSWTRQTSGRMKSDFQYSISIVYNNFPWPEPNDKQRENIEAAAQAVLDARAAHPQASLADLYDPLTMPANLLKAHQVLDKAVDAAYGYKGASTDAARVAFLFERYQAITSLLPAAEKTRKTRK
jgi:hypothetical protein